MKIAFPYSASRARYLKSMERAFNQHEFDTLFCEKYRSPLLHKSINKIRFFGRSSSANFNKLIDYNNNVFAQLTKFNPDFFFNYSGCNLFPDTVKRIRDELSCRTICFIADNPCDPLPKRDKYFAMTLRYYDILLSPEPMWDKIIKNIAPGAKIISFYGGYDPDLFFPINAIDLLEDDKSKFSCDISFTGGSYGDSPEGSYRAGILGLLESFDLKIWGDQSWQFRFDYYPSLKKAYYGKRLSYDDLRKVYALSKICLNIPSPMLFRGFQPRVFEIAASKGFQIVDHTDELYNFYDKDEIVTFKSLDDLKEKIRFYLSNPEERKAIIERMYNKTINAYSWKEQVGNIIKQL